ncbi:probable lipid-A-disaccharide synthase, mitochondrial [Tanacetum coccineum]
MRKYLSTSSQTVVDLASKEGEMRIFLVAGEVSGDIIGSRLMSALKKLSPYPIRFAGVGGSMMEKHGLNSLFPIEDIAVMGIWELLPHLNKFQVRLKETVEVATLFRPHAVVTIDSKGFSFRLLKQLKAPSFWAWKGGEARLNGLSEFIDHVLCILPFEEETCRSHGVAATFVGHPVLEDILDLSMVDVANGTGWVTGQNGLELKEVFLSTLACNGLQTLFVQSFF